MQKQIILFFLFFSFLSSSQEITIKGKISDNQNRSIQSASVSIFDMNNEILGYDFTDEKGNYIITYIPTKLSNRGIIEVSSLGYHKKIENINFIPNQTQNFVLEEKSETIQEIIIEVGKKIRIEQDTTFIKVAGFINNTEQTVEDILKKLPGIEVLKDGTIKAHGKVIDKLLIEGDDMFDKNYKFLSKNLDSKVLEEVQIIDRFEDNPIFKNLNNSDKVALNLKLKGDLQNVWFGNITLGSGIVSENRWKESLNLGLLKKKIKFFYLADYNNLGEKATDLMAINTIENSAFSEDRYEYKTKSIFGINSNEVQFFSKTQSIFNNAFLNSFSFNSKLKDNISLRGVINVTNDIQNQNSFSLTKYNLDNEPISFSEDNLYRSNKTIASTELELKYYVNDKNYITNLFIFRDDTYKTTSDLIFNTEQINQSLKNKNYTFYNHFNHSYYVSSNKILNNYFYIGNDNSKEKTNIHSPLLNSFFNTNNNALIKQNSNNKLFYIGNKSKLISKFKKIDLTNSFQLEYNKENLNNFFIVNNSQVLDYQSDLHLNQLKLISDNILRYNFSKNIDLTANLNIQNIDFRNNNNTNNTNNIFVINPSIHFNIKRTGFGNFSISHIENNSLPEINQLTNNFQLTDYRSFSKGTFYQNPLKNSILSFNHYLYNDEKRFSLNTYFSYIKSKSILNTTSILTNDFNFNSYIQTNGGESYNLNFSYVNYIRKLKLASKVETQNSWITNPINVNSSEFSNSKNFNNSIIYTGTTYFKTPINFDFGFSYNFFQSEFEKIKTNNTTKDLFLNINYKFSETILAENNNSVYVINGKNYYFNNIVINYTPLNSKFSFRLVFNNIMNENEYTYLSINNYTYYQSVIELVPRYVLGTVKYRF